MKTVNTSMDHQTGDDILCAVAHRLSGRIRSSDPASGIAPVVMSSPYWCQVLLTVVRRRFFAKRSWAALIWPFQLENQQLYMGPWSLYPMDSKEPDVLLSNAEQALFRSEKAAFTA